jgi:1,4-alpha-glucan branching enzyme
LNHLYKAEESLHAKDCESDGFEWISFEDSDQSVVSWIRKGDNSDEITLFIANYTPVPHRNYRVGVPREGFYKEILNSDSEMYFGTNVGNLGGKWSENHSWNNRPASIVVDLPPLALIGFKFSI